MLKLVQLRWQQALFVFSALSNLENKAIKSCYQGQMKELSSALKVKEFELDNSEEKN